MQYVNSLVGGVLTPKDRAIALAWWGYVYALALVVRAGIKEFFCPAWAPCRCDLCKAEERDLYAQFDALELSWSVAPGLGVEPEPEPALSYETVSIVVPNTPFPRVTDWADGPWADYPTVAIEWVPEGTPDAVDDVPLSGLDAEGVPPVDFSRQQNYPFIDRDAKAIEATVITKDGLDKLSWNELRHKAKAGGVKLSRGMNRAQVLAAMRCKR